MKLHSDGLNIAIATDQCIGLCHGCQCQKDDIVDVTNFR